MSAPLKALFFKSETANDKSQNVITLRGHFLRSNFFRAGINGPFLSEAGLIKRPINETAG